VCQLVSDGMASRVAPRERAPLRALVGGSMVHRRLRAELAVPTTTQEDMRHPSHVWADPELAQEPLDKLVSEYIHHLRGRPQPVSPETIDKYRKALLSLMRSIERQELPLVMESVTPAAINPRVAPPTSKLKTSCVKPLASAGVLSCRSFHVLRGVLRSRRR
jgi:hypothetical protein